MAHLVVAAALLLAGGTRLELQLRPRVAFAPADATLTGQLVAGGEAFHCPEVTVEVRAVRPGELAPWVSAEWRGGPVQPMQPPASRAGEWIYREVHSEECAPWEDLDADARAQALRLPIKRFRFGAGAYEVRVTVKGKDAKGRSKQLQETQSIDVR